MAGTRHASRPGRRRKATCSFWTSATRWTGLPPIIVRRCFLVGASGLSYEDAAAMCGCAVGTMKSRVNRARARLAELLAVRSDNHLESDMAWDAAVDASWSARSR